MVGCAVVVLGVGCWCLCWSVGVGGVWLGGGFVCSGGVLRGGAVQSCVQSWGGVSAGCGGGWEVVREAEAFAFVEDGVDVGDGGCGVVAGDVGAEVGGVVADLWVVGGDAVGDELLAVLGGAGAVGGGDFVDVLGGCAGGLVGGVGVEPAGCVGGYGEGGNGGCCGVPLDVPVGMCHSWDQSRLGREIGMARREMVLPTGPSTSRK